MKEAESWKQVPPQHECVEDAAIQLSRYHTELWNLGFQAALLLSRLDLFLSHSLTLTLARFNGDCFLQRCSCSSLLLSPSLAVPLCSFPSVSLSHRRLIHPGLVLTSEYETKGCSGEAPQHVVYLEHVVVRVTISHSRRGDLSITLTSPSGTVSQMLANR